MKTFTSITASAGIALGILSAPATADDFDDVVSIIGTVFSAHHTGRVLVCEGDDDDDGRSCYYIRRGYPGYFYTYDDDDGGVRWHGYDDDDDDGGRWHDDDD